MTTIRQPQPAPGDYYGVIYKGSLILPILAISILTIVVWWFLKKRRWKK